MEALFSLSGDLSNFVCVSPFSPPPPPYGKQDLGSATA